MNEPLLRLHFQEAIEQLQEILADLTATTEEADIIDAVVHLYHHLNTGWNARGLDLEPDSEDEFYRLRRMPLDIEQELKLYGPEDPDVQIK